MSDAMLSHVTTKTQLTTRDWIDRSLYPFPSRDFGGPIGLPLALDDAKRVRALVILNSWMWPHADQPNVSRVSRLVASPLGRFLYRWLNASPRWLLPATFADRQRLTPTIHRQYIAPFAHRRTRTAPWVLGCELAGSDAYYGTLWQRRHRLAGLPAALVWGTRDPAFGAPYLERWTQLLPTARVVTLSVGHFPQEEAPEEVIEAIRSVMPETPKTVPQNGGQGRRGRSIGGGPNGASR